MRQQNRETEGGEEGAGKASPEKALEQHIRSIVGQASREKLLPKILWNAAREFGSKKLVGYQKSVRRQYENELRCPLKYDPEEAKSDREKFREKVVRLMNNQLDVDYLENVRLKDRTLVTYLGRELEEAKVPTKKEFEMFRNFNERRFKETYSNLFEDQLELDIPHLYQNKSKKRCHTLQVLENREAKAVEELRSHDSVLTTQIKQTQTSAHRTPRKQHQPLVQSARRKPLIYFNEKKVVGAPIPHDEAAAVLRIMREVGCFDERVGGGELRVTKQSVVRWLRGLYEKPNRIVDFLELSEVMGVEEFWSVSRKLRVMPLEHVQFMAFLFLDGNNDGYICDYDLERLSSLALTRPVLTHDYQRIKQSGVKKLLTRRQPYLDLYKLSEVTETKYFEWRQRPHEQGEAGGLDLEMKNRMLSSKQKHIFLDFEAFCTVYRHDKPFLWYDLMMAFSATAYHGLKY